MKIVEAQEPRLSPTDRKFFHAHNFDPEFPPAFHRDTWLEIREEDVAQIHAHLDRFLREQSKRSFTLQEMSEYTHIGVQVCLPFLRARKDVQPELIRKDGAVQRWVSHARPLRATSLGIREEKEIETKVRDELGRGARADFYNNMNRGRGHKRRKVIQRF